MRAISLWQPWASWIAWGWKTVETRRHNRLACLVGQRIAIHAGRRWDSLAISIADFIGAITDEQREVTLELIGPDGRHPTGVMGTALVRAAGMLGAGDSEAAMCDCSGNDLYGLVLDEVIQFGQPVPARGYQGIWTWDEEGI